MHHRWTASADAGFSRRAASQDDVRWLRRRGPGSRREDGASASLPRAAEPDLGAGALANGGDPQETLRFGGVRIPRRLVETILRAADEAGVNPAYMMALADKESSFIADNKAAT